MKGVGRAVETEGSSRPRGMAQPGDRGRKGLAAGGRKEGGEAQSGRRVQRKEEA